MGHNDLSYVEDLNSTKDLWNMKVRVVKRWEVNDYKLDFIVIDEKGNKIQAHVRSELIPTFKPKIIEDGVYVLRKFGVGAQRDIYPVLEKKVKINIYRCTEVIPVSGFEGDMYGFNFVPFSDILAKKIPKETITVGLYLPRPVFSHGQLYVAVSRVKSKKGLKILILDEDKKISKTTTNVVYKEVLQYL